MPYFEVLVIEKLSFWSQSKSASTKIFQNLAKNVFISYIAVENDKKNSEMVLQQSLMDNSTLVVPILSDWIFKLWWNHHVDHKYCLYGNIANKYVLKVSD